MPEDTGQQKTEQPTPRKIEKARQKGNVAKSPEISSFLIILSALLVFLFGGSWMFYKLSDFMGGVLRNSGTLELESDSLHQFIFVIFDQISTILLPIMIAVFFAGLVGNVAQTGFMLTSKPFQPEMKKFNPISGLKRIVSLKSFVEVIKAIFKMLFIGCIAFVSVENEMESFPALMHLGVSEIARFIATLAFKISFYVCLAMLVLAALDYSYQRWQYRKDLMMTKQEVLEESKQSEGDPKVKNKIRQIQIETARRRMMEKIPEADVVVTNPTHLAVALKYDAANMMAPKVIAKGAGLIAERIKKIAEENSVPVMEHKSLARTLFKLVELGDFIPGDLYRAVAEVLAYVYNLKKGNNDAP